MTKDDHDSTHAQSVDEWHEDYETVRMLYANSEEWRMKQGLVLWVRDQRIKYKNGSLAPERLELLKYIPGVLDLLPQDQATQEYHYHSEWSCGGSCGSSCDEATRGIFD